MPQHGFVADFDFEVADKQADQVTLSLKSTDETKKYYPFDFGFDVTFVLTDQA